MRIPAIVLFGLVACAPAAVVAAEDECRRGGADVPVREVVDGQTLRTAGAALFFLAGVDVPRSGTGSATARDRLDELAGARHVLAVSGAEDRHGRLPSQIFLPGGLWLQEVMVREGLALAKPFPGPVPCIERLLAAEKAAREAGAGFWRDEFRPQSADDPSLIDRKGLYVVVEGRVASVGHGNRLDFLNFGWNWQRDFTVMVDVAISSRFAEGGVPLGDLAGKRVRVRGVIEASGGPAIRVNDHREIEILDNG